MSTRSKIIKMKCSRCSLLKEGIQIVNVVDKVVSIFGFYKMKHFPHFKQDPAEDYVCSSCMWSCEKYIEKYGSLLTF